MNNDKESDKDGLTKEEGEVLQNWIQTAEANEMVQVEDLVSNCNITYQFARTHSAYVKDWEKTREQMVEKLEDGELPPDTSSAFFEAMILATDEIMERKLEAVRQAFQIKFGESIYNYLGPDGKTKKLFGLFG